MGILSSSSLRSLKLGLGFAPEKHPRKGEAMSEERALWLRQGACALVNTLDYIARLQHATVMEKNMEAIIGLRN